MTVHVDDPKEMHEAEKRKAREQAGLDRRLDDDEGGE